MPDSEMASGIDDRSLLEQLEASLWRDESRFDRELMEQIFAIDSFEFGQSGRIWSREECLRLAQRMIGANLPLHDVFERLIGGDVALVTYAVDVGCGDALRRSYRSPLWSRAGGRWRLRSHQETPIARELNRPDGDQMWNWKGR